MTVPKTSKMVTDRQKRYELVIEIAGAQREDLIGALNRRFQDDDVPSSGDDVAAYLDSLLGCLKRRFDDLLQAERNHLDELSDDDARRKRRDTAVSELREVLFGLRNLLRGAFGVLPTQELGFENRFEPHPLPLLRQALRIEQRLRDPAVEMPEPRFRGVTVDLESLADQLSPYLRELREAIDGVTVDLARVQGTKVAKDDAIEAFDQTRRHVVSSLVEAFRLAGMTELAARLSRSS